MAVFSVVVARDVPLRRARLEPQRRRPLVIKLERHFELAEAAFYKPFLDVHGADLAHEAVVLSQKGVVTEDRLRELALEVLRRPGVRRHRKVLEAVAARADARHGP